MKRSLLSYFSMVARGHMETGRLERNGTADLRIGRHDPASQGAVALLFDVEAGGFYFRHRHRRRCGSITAMRAFPVKSSRKRPRPASTLPRGPYALLPSWHATYLHDADGYWRNRKTHYRLSEPTNLGRSSSSAQGLRRVTKRPDKCTPHSLRIAETRCFRHALYELTGRLNPLAGDLQAQPLDRL